jgi:hypothetical protein
MATKFSPTQNFLLVIRQNLSAPDPKVIRHLRPRPRPVITEPALARA